MLPPSKYDEFNYNVSWASHNHSKNQKFYLKIRQEHFIKLYAISMAVLFSASPPISVDMQTYKPLHLARWNYARSCKLGAFQTTCRTPMNIKVTDQKSRSHFYAFLFAWCTRAVFSLKRESLGIPAICPQRVPPRTTFKQLYVRTRSTRQGLWKITSAVKERNSISTWRRDVTRRRRRPIGNHSVVVASRKPRHAAKPDPGRPTDDIDWPENPSR